jgi:hypothetical protein
MAPRSDHLRVLIILIGAVVWAMLAACGGGGGAPGPGKSSAQVYEFSFSGPVGGPFASPDGTLEVFTGDLPDADYRVTSNAPWLKWSLLELDEPVGGKRVGLSVDGESAPTEPGEYLGRLKLKDSETDATVAIIDVTLDVLHGPQAHSFTGLPMTSDGWTSLLTLYQHPDLYSDSRIIYVSSSTGSDSTGAWYSSQDPLVNPNPFDPNGTIRPFQTLPAAQAHLRDGYPDILLLRRGDVWDDTLGTISASGRSSLERLLIATYGTDAERPILRTGDRNGLNSGSVRNLLVVGLHFFGHTWQQKDPGRAVNILGVAQDHLYEDCLFERMATARVQGWPLAERHERIAFRRCIWLEGPSGSLFAHLYAVQTNDLLIEENVFSSPIEKNRHLYLSPAGNEDSSTLRGVILRGNIFFASRRTGLSIRSGGLIENNLVAQNDLILVGGHGGSRDSIQSGRVVNNVILESTPDGAGDGEWGLALLNIDGGVVRGNIWADPTHLGVYSYAIILMGSSNVTLAKNITISGNIIHGRGGSGFGRALRIDAPFDEVSGVNITGNDFQMVEGSGEILQHSAQIGFAGFTYRGNRYFSTESEESWFFQGGLTAWLAASGETDAENVRVEYPDPGRTLKTYNQALGGVASSEAFMLRATRQSRLNWDSAYTAAAVNRYIREGFGLPAEGLGE